METSRELAFSPPDGNGVEWQVAAVHSLMLYVIPQMEGIREDEASSLGEAVEGALHHEIPSSALVQALQDLRAQLLSGPV